MKKLALLCSTLTWCLTSSYSMAFTADQPSLPGSSVGEVPDYNNGPAGEDLQKNAKKIPMAQ